MFRPGYLLILLLAFSTAPSCVSYQNRQSNLNEAFQREDFQTALHVLEKPKRNADKVLYFLQKGHLLLLTGKSLEAHTCFLKADELSETFKQNMASETLSAVSGPESRTYQPEGHERIMMHYYHALSFVLRGLYESALVECRRMNLQLQQLNNSGNALRKYREDAFGHLLMGIVYETTGDMNNAFIAYRNAHDVYENSYQNIFDCGVPEFLKQALVRSANAAGLAQEASFYTLKYPAQPQRKSAANLVLLIETGRGAAKRETVFNFNYLENSNRIEFNDTEKNLRFSYPANQISEFEKLYLKKWASFRLVLPKYDQGLDNFKTTEVFVNGEKMTPDPVQPLAKIAEQSLYDRLGSNLSEAFIRQAIHHSAQLALKEQSQQYPIDISQWVAIASGKADLRYWNTLPANIVLLELPLKHGLNEFLIEIPTQTGAVKKHTLRMDATRGRTYLRSIRLINATV